MSKNIVLKRIIAWIIDWNISGLPCCIYSTILSQYLKHNSFSGTSGEIIMIVLFVVLLVLYPVSFVFRDVIIKGRSIGKRIFKLYVYEYDSDKEASVFRKVVRNLFFFIYAVDGVILIFTKRSIGDMIADTTVIIKD